MWKSAASWLLIADLGLFVVGCGGPSSPAKKEGAPSGAPASAAAPKGLVAPGAPPEIPVSAPGPRPNPPAGR